MTHSSQNFFLPPKEYKRFDSITTRHLLYYSSPDYYTPATYTATNPRLKRYIPKTKSALVFSMVKDDSYTPRGTTFEAGRQRIASRNGKKSINQNIIHT
jgi:hypothetical protein